MTELPKPKIVSQYGFFDGVGYTAEQMNQYGQVCFEEGVHSNPNPYGWLTAADEEMVCAHLGVAELSDTYEVAKKKLQDLINWHIAVATDPTVNGGFSLQPVSEYRMAMNAIHEPYSPTFMGEPVLGGIEP